MYIFWIPFTTMVVIIMARGSCPSSNSSDFFKSVLYAIQKLQMMHTYIKKEQHSSMKAIYNGHDMFVWLPTGCGKSLCYQALLFLMVLLLDAITWASMQCKQLFTYVAATHPSIIVIFLYMLIVPNLKHMHATVCTRHSSQCYSIECNRLGTEWDSHWCMQQVC